ALLAEALQKHFADADSALVADAGQSIPDIFAQRGEAVFRELETQTLAKLAMRSGMVIATGGGCVTKEENYP
ncbi:shikimate kinase, partial [Klebsiella pneumoniae]|uniref:shikimate kinase n=1 Tax=Klebsiella pneumoniae TaxID=573 RepID=UPI0025A29803